jgi:hypothetical protein
MQAYTSLLSGCMGPSRMLAPAVSLVYIESDQERREGLAWRTPGNKLVSNSFN